MVAMYHAGADLEFLKWRVLFIVITHKGESLKSFENPLALDPPMGNLETDKSQLAHLHDMYV